MTKPTFTNRRLEKFTVKSQNGTSIISTDSSGISVPEYVVPEIVVGATYYLELYKFNDIAGLMQEDGLYLFHRSDQYFKIKLDSYLEEAERKRKEWYEANKHDIKTRTDALQPRYRARIERFLGESESFRTQPMGWGYELVTCELAQMYERSGGEDNSEIDAFAQRHGTSGNQHNVAKMWAKNPEVKI